MVGQRYSWRPARRARPRTSADTPAAHRQYQIKLVPNLGSSQLARRHLVAKGCDWKQFLKDCAARLGTTLASSGMVALCRADDGVSISSFPELRDGLVVTVLFAGSSFRRPPAPPAATQECAYDPSMLGKLEGVARIDASDPELPALLRAAMPLIIENAPLVDEATRLKWAESRYLGARLDEQANRASFMVLVATTGMEPSRYAYHDFHSPERVRGQYLVPGPPSGTTALRRGSFSKFEAWRRTEGERFYLHTTLVEAASVQPDPKNADKRHGTAKVKGHSPLVPGARETSPCVGDLLNDVRGFGWTWLQQVMAGRPQGRPYRQSQCFIGGPSGVTPLHFDTYDNLLLQVSNTKRVLLVSPDQFHRCYPYPHHHPKDRQSRVELQHVDTRRFPAWHGVKAMEAELLPGDALHLPPYWWHQVQMMRPESASPAAVDSYNISLNFWFDAAPWEAGSPTPAQPPPGYVSEAQAAEFAKLWPKECTLAPHQLVGLGRDIEQTIAENLGGQNVGMLLRKGTPEGGAPEGGWAGPISPAEHSTILAINIALLSRGFDSAAAAAFVRELYRGRFEGLAQGPRGQEPPEWWR